MTTRSGSSSVVRGWTCSSTIVGSSSGRRYAASVARPSGGKSEYLMGRQYGLVASVSAGRMNLTRSRLTRILCIVKYTRAAARRSGGLFRLVVLDHPGPLAQLRVRDGREAAVVLPQFDRGGPLLEAELDRALEVLGVRGGGLEHDLRPELLHQRVDRDERLREIGVEVVVVEHAALLEPVAALVHEAHGELRVTGSLPQPGAQRIHREDDARGLPAGVVLDTVAQAFLVGLVGEARGAQRLHDRVLAGREERLRRERHARRHG